MRFMDRRGCLSAMLATGALALLEGPAMAARRKPFFQAVGRPIGLQLYTLGGEVGRDIDAAFAQVAAIGYRDLELPNLFGRPPAEIRRAADGAGLAISSLHLGVGPMGGDKALTLASDPARIAEALGTLGAKRAVLPVVPFPANFRPLPGEKIEVAVQRTIAAAGVDIWKRTAALLNERAAKLKPLGIRLGYHNHNIEFAPIGTTTGWDILMRETDPRLVDIELDVGWVATAGLDPVAVLKSLSGRVTQLHVKDVAATNVVSFALSMSPSEVGSGTLDWARILPTAHKAGVRHFYVEQEPPFAIARMEAIRRSYGFLAQIGA